MSRQDFEQRSIVIGAPGVVLVDKPVGPTSFDMVRVVRQVWPGRIGHSGTLDPFASGLLIMLLGPATRLAPLLLTLPKEYEMVVQFGANSSTGDPTGEISGGGPMVDAQAVLRAIDHSTGRVTQKVPLTSAVKVGGESLYKKAHRGERAETPEREVNVYETTLVDFDEGSQRAQVVVLCGSGTYLRVVAEDLGRSTGAGAYAAALRRTRIGSFHVGRAAPVRAWMPDHPGDPGRAFLGLEEALAWLPRQTLDAEQAWLVAHGNQTRIGPDGRFRVYDGERLAGVYAARGGVGRPILTLPDGA